jgi:HPt (histidine-containing phosphotransfer) domain-containing protein
LLTSLQQALAGQDSEQFRQAAHSIKSTSNSFGALKLGALAKELEMMGRERNLEGAPAIVYMFLEV